MVLVDTFGRSRYQGLAYIKRREAQEEQLTHLVGHGMQLLVFAVLAFLVVWLYPGQFPLNFNDGLLWKGATISQIFSSTWPVFVWALVASMIYAAFTRHGNSDRQFAADIYRSKMAVALQAGVLEELNYRLLLFIIGIGWIPVLNWITFGWNGGGLVKWFYTDLIIPIVNWMTFGSMTELLVTVPWFVGAALVSANASFRDGHKYQGLFGMINSWYIGMFLFWTMFEYGLLAAIAVHAIYDGIIFTVRHIDVLRDTRHSYY